MQSLLGPILLMKASMPMLYNTLLNTGKKRFKLLRGNNQTMAPPAKCFDLNGAGFSFSPQVSTSLTPLNASCSGNMP